MALGHSFFHYTCRLSNSQAHSRKAQPMTTSSHDPEAQQGHQVYKTTPVYSLHLATPENVVPISHLLNKHLEWIHSGQRKQTNGQLLMQNVTIDGLSKESRDLRHIMFVGARFTLCSFDGSLFDNSVFLGCTFIKCSFEYSIFDDASLQNCTFVECSLFGASFDSATIEQCAFVHCTGSAIYFRDTTINKTNWFDSDVHGQGLLTIGTSHSGRYTIRIFEGESDTKVFWPNISWLSFGVSLSDNETMKSVIGENLNALNIPPGERDELSSMIILAIPRIISLSWWDWDPSEEEEFNLDEYNDLCAYEFWSPE